MRIDKFLKVSRLIKRRTLSQIACQNRRVFLNDRVAKPASPVKVGDEITIVSSVLKLRVKVTAVPVGNVAKGELYEVMEEQRMMNDE
ncbi:MAG: S4 domain-containing protein [Atribacterota bacterium]